MVHMRRTVKLSFNISRKPIAAHVAYTGRATHRQQTNTVDSTLYALLYVRIQAAPCEHLVECSNPVFQLASN